MYKLLIKPIFFSLQPEKAHYLAMDLLSGVLKIPGMKAVFRNLYCKENPSLAVEAFGLRFPNMVGLAAGFDKDGRWIEELAHLGFGFIEVGTVTPKPQPGNPKPRLFRLPQDNALINRMGFNNEGVEALATRLAKLPQDRKYVLGGNIGKNKDTPNENATDDYVICFERLFEVVDYFVVNVSSPNTPGLRALQDKEPLTQLLQTLQQLNLQKPAPKPILLKIAPDLNESQLDDIVEIVAASGIAGVIATNTTIDRSGLKTPNSEVESIGMGGLSGAPVREKANHVISYLHNKSEGKLPIIAVGGIATAADAKQKRELGAKLVQVYTGFIYEGPGIAKRILS